MQFLPVNTFRVNIFTFVSNDFGIMKIIDTGKSRIIIAPVSPADHIGDLTPADRDYLAGVGSQRRREEGATWRSLVRGESGDVDISYDDTGAPVVCGGKWPYVGISHAGGYVAVIFSFERCAIDMENTERDFSRASSRYISRAEMNIPGSDDPLFPAAVWCAKETLYKYSGLKGLDLAGDLRISGVDFDEGEIGGAVLLPDGRWENHNMGMFFYEGLLIVFLEGSHNLGLAIKE